MIYCILDKKASCQSPLEKATGVQGQGTCDLDRIIESFPLCCLIADLHIKRKNLTVRASPVLIDPIVELNRIVGLIFPGTLQPGKNFWLGAGPLAGDHKEGEMKKGKNNRLLLGKMGLDAHDNGIIIVAKWLSDAGFEVIYAGIYNTAESILQSALQEGVNAIGCSFLGGEHLFYVRKLTDLLKTQQIDNIKLILGGVIPAEDLDELKRLGVGCVFTPGTMRDTIIDTLTDYLKESE